MAQVDERRLRTLEQRTASLAMRLERIEARIGTPSGAADPSGPPTATVEPVASAPPSPPGPPPAEPAPPRAPSPTLEDLLGGRVLAWAGGVAVVLGVAFLLAIAVSNGWIGEGARTLMAGLAAAALIGTGIWLQERRRRSDAALATLAAGIAAMFITVAVGGPVYAILPTAAAISLALGTGALATAFAIRWESRLVGALGIVGALLAPILAGAPSTGATLAVLWVAGLAGVGVLVWQRWNWLALAVFAVALAQWSWWLAFDHEPAAILLVLTAFGALNAGAAVAFELRVPAARLRPSSAMLLTLNAIVLAVGGWYALDAAQAQTLAHVWIGALAVGHLAVGLATARTRLNRDVRLLALALGVVLADVALAVVFDEPLRALAWAISTAGFAILARHLLAGRDPERPEHDETLLAIGLGGHLLLTSAQALVLAPPSAIGAGDPADLAGYAAIAAATCASFVAGRFAAEARRGWRAWLDAVALAGAAYLTALALDGAVLAAALAGQALLLGLVAARGRDAVAAWGGAAYLATAIVHAVVFEAPLDALVSGLDDLYGAALALGAVALAALRGAHLLARTAPPADEHHAAIAQRARATLTAAGAVALLYLASTALLTPFQPGDGAPLVSVLDLGVRQLGQALLSGLWAIIGLAALVIGLRRDERILRTGGLALLFVTVGKVFLYDLAALTSLYRVGSFIALGLLLLVAAGVWQRMRPRPLPDLRATPPALR